MDEADMLPDDDSEMQPSDDPLYCPGKDDCDTDDDETNASTQPVEADRIFEAKFLVFESCLRELLDRCLFCGAPHCKIELDFVGTMVRAAVTCPASHTRTWRSQPVFHRRPMGNISVCAATLFTGSSPTKVLRLFSLMGMQSLQKTSFFKIQRCYLVPAVTEVWLSEQATLLDKLRGRKLCLAGDGRADTPGHSADFGTYTLLETTANRVIHTELVKSTEVSSSNRMEAEGLQRCLDYLHTQEMSVDILVTDRHSEGKASLRDHYPEINHRFDVWHVAKGVKKKIIAVARTKQHSVLLLWLKTIIRHIYWCARTSNGDGQLVLAKWTSLMRHIINIHEHPDPLHPVCEHGSTPERLWLVEGTETFNKLKAILMAPHLLRDIPFLSPKEQTSGLESYHAVLIHFAPKATKFRYEGMLARTYVAALHFNHNADRKVLLDENGKPRFRQKWSKGEKQWTLVAVKEKVTYDYVRKLVDSVLECVTRWPSYAVAERATYRQSHDTLTSRCGAKPQMEDAIARHRSRFSAGSV
ncbi:hypothetical protein HPB47_018430 [Ixodes persulcatus]|uniref:Uncharacterized protein n=1 Tax=Ixodes persulcatus TaxID=34615 RepID=A0AC60QP90_IXOPE|nr:hypothetical protein HPB47_018430 [Ixodes persulcatus]